MELTPHLEAIRGDLESLVAADQALASAFERMARPIEATLQLRLLDVLGDAALELTEQFPTGHTELRVAGRDARLVYVGPPEPAPEPPAANPDIVRPDDEEPAQGEDVLEETPEFLQETPEHDRLWFEQKPPRDFDF